MGKRRRRSTDLLIERLGSPREDLAKTWPARDRDKEHLGEVEGALKEKSCVAMLLAGGEGRRLKQLTRKTAKPAVHFGGKYRIIDFTLSNCTNSGIDTVGVLTQYHPMQLNQHIGIGTPWDLDRKEGGVSILSPHVKCDGGGWYKGTANAIYQNLDYIEQFDPAFVLIISGDHVYKMDYNKLIQFHQDRRAEATIAAIHVRWEETHRFGVLTVNEQSRIVDFEEKPKQAVSNLASMGVYLFSWRTLRKYLLLDEDKPDSSNDFGKDVIPMMLEDGVGLYAYPFSGYWKDVGTVESLWEANMDLLDDERHLDLGDRNWRIYTQNPNQPPQYIAAGSCVRRSLIPEGCTIYGNVDHSVLFYGVTVGEGSMVEHSVVMPHVRIGRNVTVHHAVIGEGAAIEDGMTVGHPHGPITLVGSLESVSRATIHSLG